MKNVAVLIFSIILTASVSWLIARHYYSERYEINKKIYQATDSNLQRSNVVLEQINSQYSHMMLNKLYDPNYHDDAIFWKPKFDSVQMWTAKMLEIINTNVGNINSELKDKSGYPSFSTLRAKLSSTLKLYSTAILRQIPFEKRKDFTQLPIHQLLLLMNEPNASDNVFEYNDSSNLPVLLSKIKNDVLLSNDILLNFYIQQCSKLIYKCGGPYALVTQNTTCLKRGEMLEITAGLGSYEFYAKPKITINNKQIDLTKNGNAVYRTKITKNTSGLVPVVISYRDPNTGVITTISKNITYTVFQAPL